MLQVSTLDKTSFEQLRHRLLVLEADIKNISAAEEQPESSNGDLPLDDMILKDAVYYILKREKEQGRDKVEAGEIEGILQKYRIRTHRGGTGAERNKPIAPDDIFWVLTKMLTSPPNRKIFRLDRMRTKGLTRADTVSLV